MRDFDSAFHKFCKSEPLKSRTLAKFGKSYLAEHLS